MASLLILDAIGPKAEELAIEAGAATGIPVGYDPELDCATFDADALDDDELQTVVFEALAGVDPEWRTHLRLAD